MLESGCTHAVMEINSAAIDQGKFWGIGFEVGIFTNLAGFSDDPSVRSMRHMAKQSLQLPYSGYSTSMQGSQGKSKRSDPGVGAQAPQNISPSFICSRVTAIKGEAAKTPFEGEGVGSEGARGWMEKAYQLQAQLFKGQLGSKPKLAIINLDDPYGQRLYGEIHESVETITYGTLPACDLQIVEMMGSACGTEFLLKLGNRRYRGHLPMIGAHNVMNAFAALSAAYALGLSVKDSVAALENFPGVPGRLERIVAGQDFEVIVDCARTSETLRETQAILRASIPGRIITVFDSSEAQDRREAIADAILQARLGDCVLIAGRGHETTMEFADAIVPFDDRTVAREILKEYSHAHADTLA
jgi:UDP-N-acetylmuramyl tripeptide synthase